MSPMLASAPVAPLRFPLLCTPKVDGVRCVVSGGKARTRSGKPIPNRHIRSWIERHCPEGFDGEITVGASFSETTAAVMRRDGTPDFTFHVFDFVFADFDDPYSERMAELARLEPDVQPCPVRFLLPVEIGDQAAFDAYYAHCLAEGFEGVIARDPDGAYEPGRPAARAQTLLKIKPQADAEAEVIAAEPGQHGLAALRVRWQGREFSIGTGFSSSERADLWRDRAGLAGRLVKFSHPVREGRAVLNSCSFLGLRDRDDL